MKSKQTFCCNCYSRANSRSRMLGRIGTKHHPPSRKSSKIVSEGIADFQLPGFSQVIRKENSTTTRILWAFMCGIILSGCTYQCGERILYFYTSKPVMNTIRVTKSSILFPAIVVCPIDRLYRNPAVDPSLLQELYGNISYSTVYELMDKTQMDLKTLWNISRLVVTSIKAFLNDREEGRSISTILSRWTYHSMNITDVSLSHLAINLLLAKLKTLLVVGENSCYKLLEQEIQRHGLLSSIGYAGFRKQSGIESGYFQIAYTTEERIPILKYFYTLKSIILPMKSLNSVILSIEEVHLLNTWHLPCEEEISITKCLIDCIQNDIFSKVVTPCRLPYMEPSPRIPECFTSQEFRDVYNATSQVLQQFKVEKCTSCSHRQCKEIIYSLESFTYHRFESVFFQSFVAIVDNRVPYTQEENIYSFVALFSDIGGSLGFFLGICALQIIELLSVTCNTARKRFSYLLLEEE